MTDTRKEFDDYFVSSNPLENLVGYEREVALESWQACQQLNDNRIQQLLALVEKKNEALGPIADMSVHFPMDKQIGTRPTTGVIYGCMDKHGEHSIDVEHLHDAKAALALTADDVELVEVNHVDYVEVDPAHYDVVSTLDEGEKLYKIQMKGK